MIKVKLHLYYFHNYTIIKTISFFLQVTMVKSQKVHTHPADYFEVAAMKVKAEIKASVQSQHSDPSDVIAERCASTLFR